MPELPEVQTVVNTLRPRVVGRRIARIRLNRTDILSPAGTDLPSLLAGRTIDNITRRGKRIVFTLDTGDRFYVHLGMTGRLILNSPDDALLPHTHLLLDLDNQSELRFADPRRFGGIWWLGSNHATDDMGPDPLRTRPQQLAKRLARTTRAIKNALLDQTVLAGLGNIYVDESLFAAGIHPLTPANTLPAAQIARLNRAIKSTLRSALRHRGSTLRDYRDADGLPGDFQSRHRVYDREGNPCPKCRTPIRRIVLGGRSTHFCPKCQH
jgi:formamidopyrimidine-DNA glycosylase